MPIPFAFKHRISGFFFVAFLTFGASAQQVEKDAEVLKDSLYLSETVSETAPGQTSVKTSVPSPVLIDSLWLETLYSSPLYQGLPKTVEVANDSLLDLNLPTELLKERLECLNQQTPFNLEYNPELERLIRFYLKTRSKYYPKMMARALYYFPMFEAHLDAYDIPLEIKYLAVVESALNPRAKSRVGATGIWQFMYPTGKQFGLKVSSYVDERQDPLKSVKAACQYLQRLYATFQDWDLALAAYNSGPGNVSKAIRRSGGHRNYWNIRPFLPRETAGYLPAFYATLYVFEHANDHGIYPVTPLTHHFATDTVQVKRLLTFEQLNETLNVSIELLQFLNPQYKLDIIPYVKNRFYTLRMPLEMVGQFVQKEAEIYAYADREEARMEKPLPQYFEMNQRIRYKVKSGDYLGKIAHRYGVRVSDLKKWNGLRSTHLSVGQRLTVYPRRLNYTGDRSKASSQRKSQLSRGKKFEYTVQKGDSLWSISKKYPKISIRQIKEWNGIWHPKHLQPGEKIILYKSS